jgi:hypothetical protein
MRYLKYPTSLMFLLVGYFDRWQPKIRKKVKVESKKFLLGKDF